MSSNNLHINIHGNFRLVLLNVGHAEHYNDWNFTNIISPFARIYFVTEGEGVVTIENTSHILKPGFLYLIPPFTVHTDFCKGKFSLYYLHVYEENTNSISYFEQVDLPFEIPSIKLDKLLFERIYQINPERKLFKYDPKEYDNQSNLLKNIKASKNRPFHISLETTAIIQQLFSKFIAHAQMRSIASDQRIINILKFINNHLHEQISITELAEQSCLTVDHFIRIFKKHLKNTPVNFINQKRIEKAQLMLTVSDIPIKEIAFNLSFNNVTYFNRLFKRFTGTTPAEYKRNSVR